MKEYKEIPFMNSNLKELLKDLRKRLTKYDGRYKTKQFKEWVESLLMLETDILNDGTYTDRELEYIKRIRFVNRIINFNIYGSIRKLTENDNTLKWLNKPYNEDEVKYMIYPKNNSDSLIPSIELNYIEKPTIKIQSSIVLSEYVRYEQIDKLIDTLYQNKKEGIMKVFSENYHYNSVLGYDIKRLNSLVNRNDLTDKQVKISELNYNLFEKFRQEYGPFEERYDYSQLPPRQKQEEININKNGEITGESVIKETPVAVFKKVIQYY